MDGPVPVDIDRSRLAWWGVVAVLGAFFVGFLVSFVGTFVLGLFFYYAVRPLHEHVDAHVNRRGVSATVTLALILLPVLGLISYTALLAARELVAVVGPTAIERLLVQLPGDPESIRTIIQSPRALLDRLENQSQLAEYVLRGLGLFGSGANALFHLTLALAIAFFLLRDGPRIEAWFRTNIADDGGIAETYATAVDADLQTVYFGNVLSVVAVAMLSLVVFHGFNLLTPSTLSVPFPTLLALLTGLATFVPLVVGKIVYLPVTVYLAYAATRAGETTGLVWVGAFAIVAFLLLDLIPQTFIRPYISGRSLHSGLVLFAYVLGAALFGWYGLFLGPFLVILLVQAANIVLPELLHGDPLSVETHLDIGTDPTAKQEDAVVDEPIPAADDPSTGAGDDPSTGASDDTDQQ